MKPGEELAVNIECDNSQCKSAIKSFKLKLYRTVTFVIDNQQKQIHEFVTQVKLPGCSKKSSVVKEYSMEVPALERDSEI